MHDPAAELFEHELARRGVPFSYDPKEDRYTVEWKGRTLYVSLDNLKREYARRADASFIQFFVDAVLADPFEPPVWREAASSVLFCLEPSDYEVGGPDLRLAISEKVDRVPVHFDNASGTISWISSSMLRDWGVSLEEVEAVAFKNLAARLLEAKAQHHEISGVGLGYLETTLPFKSALILAPNLKEIISPILGWPLLAVIPDRDFLYLWDARHKEFIGRVRGVVVKEFKNAPYPITTEVFEISDEGIKAIGAFPVN